MAMATRSNPVAALAGQSRKREARKREDKQKVKEVEHGQGVKE